MTVPENGLDLDGVTMQWDGSSQLQKAPPYGGSNFFSAGVSDGKEPTYKSVDGNVSVVHVSPDGDDSPATWATKAAQDLRRRDPADPARSRAGAPRP
ncbi:hypothetical protein [Aeromicrobium sp. UC242_57]|uniref:hypothetical protein n=1 Tax=Aeromicrobium sp. UC242_57 TaxID=3374624 RepID=UPI0037A59CBA